MTGALMVHALRDSAWTDGPGQLGGSMTAGPVIRANEPCAAGLRPGARIFERVS